MEKMSPSTSEEEKRKKRAIQQYMNYIYQTKEFKEELSKEIEKAFANGRL